MTPQIDIGPVSTIYSAAVSGTGNGSTFALPPQGLIATWQVLLGASPASITVQLQASLDGVNWAPIDNTSAIVSSVRMTTVAARFIRAAVTAMAGGDTVVVNIFIAPIDVANSALSGIGVLATQPTAVGNGADITEDTLFSYTLPGRTFIQTGRVLRMRAFGHTGANANTKTLRAKFGADAWIALNGAVNNADWTLELLVMRRSFGVFIRRGSMNIQGVLPGASVFAAAVDETSPITLAITGQTSLATANDVTVEGVIVDSIPPFTI